MKKIASLISLSFLMFLLAFDSSAQSLLNNGEIPDDLLITVKQQGGWGGALYEMTIDAKGEFSYKSSGGLPIRTIPLTLLIKGQKPQKPPIYLKPQLSAQKLKLLIAEFEKIGFFNLDTNQDDGSLSSDSGGESISIRINGQTKEVGNYLGGSRESSRALQVLAEKIRGSGIWNFENGEIPEVFWVSYTIVIGNKVLKDFKIGPIGNITENIFTYTPSPKITNETQPAFVTTTKAVGQLSNQQLKQLIDEFERSGFGTFTYRTLGQINGCSNGPRSIPEKRTQINISINRIPQMYASLYENCDPKPDTEAAKFEYMNSVISNMLKTVGAIK